MLSDSVMQLLYLVCVAVQTLCLIFLIGCKVYSFLKYSSVKDNLLARLVLSAQSLNFSTHTTQYDEEEAFPEEKTTQCKECSYEACSRRFGCYHPQKAAREKIETLPTASTSGYQKASETRHSKKKSKASPLSYSDPVFQTDATDHLYENCLPPRHIGLDTVF